MYTGFALLRAYDGTPYYLKQAVLLPCAATVFTVELYVPRVPHAHTKCFSSEVRRMTQVFTLFSSRRTSLEVGPSKLAIYMIIRYMSCPGLTVSAALGEGGNITGEEVRHSR